MTGKVKELDWKEEVQGCASRPGEWAHVSDRHVASGEDERQHDENRMRYIHIGKRRSETANEEQPDKLWKTDRFVQKAPNPSSSSTMHVSLEYPASGA